MINVKLEKFEGPLGLLLQLIEKNELDITEVSLARVADQYVDYIKLSPGIEPDEMADFLVVAARLLLIKSKALLPYLYPEEEEEIAELENQLKMYKEFFEAAKKIEKMVKKGKFMFARQWSRQAVLKSVNFFSPPANLRADDLRMVFSDILGKVFVPVKLEEAMLEAKVNIEEKIDQIRAVLNAREKLAFSNVLKNAKSRTEVIVSFLAMLELIKQRDIIITQDGIFAEIFISKNENKKI